MNIEEAFSEVERLLEAGWTQGAPARNRLGAPVPYDSPDAVCFCVRGALERSCLRENGSFAQGTFRYALGYLEQAAREKAPLDRLIFYHDRPERTKEEVLGIVRRARELALASESENRPKKQRGKTHAQLLP